MMRINRQILLFLVLAFGCANLRAEPLPASSGFVLSDDNEDQVYIDARVLSEAESKEYVHDELLKHGFQPILVQIDNTSPFSYELKKDQADIRTVSAKKIVKEVGKSARPRSIAYKVLGFFFWPLTIPGTIDSIQTKNKEFTLKRDLEAKTLKREGEIIPPYSSVSRVLYVPQNEIKEMFQLSMTNIEAQRVENYYLVIES